MVKGKPRSKSNPVPSPPSTRYVKSVKSILHQSFSLDFQDTDPKLKPSNVDQDQKVSGIDQDEDSDSNSDCYVVPVQQDHTVPMSYMKETRTPDDENDDDVFSDEYDYPYMDGLNRLSFDAESPSSNHGYENVHNKAVSHSRVNVTKNRSANDRKQLLSNSKPSKGKIMPTPSQDEILEPLAEHEEYIKMYPEELSVLVKSHLCYDSRELQSVSDQQVTPRASTTSSQAGHNYKNVNRATPVTPPTDGKYVHFTYCISRNIGEHYIWQFAQKTLFVGF